MRMDPADIKRFPKMRYYVSINIPQVAKVGVIINTIQDISGTIEKQTIKDALLWNKDPVIKIVKGLGALGAFSPNTSSNEIRVDEDLVKQFESGKGLRKTPKGQLVYLLGVTLLHELTHWADDQDGVDFEGGSDGEEGNEFERRIYGGVIN